MLGANALLVDSCHHALGDRTIDQFFEVLTTLAGRDAATLWDRDVVPYVAGDLSPQLLHDGSPDQRPLLKRTVRVYFTRGGFSVDHQDRSYAVALWKRRHKCWYVVTNEKWPLLKLEQQIAERIQQQIAERTRRGRA